MDIDDVRTFVTVVEAGSVSGAAGELHLTQPAVTRRLQRFEDVVGAPLLDRRRRPLALTDLGRAALERCRRLLSSAEELKSLAQDGTLPSREVRIGVAHALTEVALADPVDEVRRAFPGVVLRLRTGWSRELLGRVRSGALDAAVILLPDEERLPVGVTGEALGKERLVVVAARHWRSRAREIRDLSEMGWVLNPEGCAARAGLQEALARARLPLRVSVETYNYELQLSLIARERGLGLVPSRLLARSPTRSRLRTLRVRGLGFPLTIWMATGELEAAADLAVRALARVLGERLSGSSRRRQSVNSRRGQGTSAPAG
jgi:DNA-binding transcriptional LysR family regulator